MDKKIWKSLDELKFPVKSQINKQIEFQDSVKEEFDPNQLTGISRRKFLAISAASFALTTVACTNYRDKGEIVPYNQKPENVLPGKSNFYASTCTGCSNHCGILIKTREGRPIKVDGNPDHPVNKGKICATAQASILNLFNPERYKKPLKNNNGKWEEIEFLAAFSSLLGAINKAATEGKEIAIISKPIFSPSFAKILNDFKTKFPNTKIYTYDFLEPYPKQRAWMDFYPNQNPKDLDFSKAKIIVSLESNFLANEGNFVRNISDFVKNRDVNSPQNFSRFYSFESDLTLTGANADYRIPLHPSQYTYLLGTLINEIINSNKLLVNNFPLEQLRSKFSIFKLNEFVKENNIELKLIKRLVDDLLANQGSSIIIAGDSLNYEAHLLTYLLNEILGNSANYRPKALPVLSKSSLEEFSILSNSIQNGTVGLIINLDCNPIYHLPKDLGFQNNFKKVSDVFSFLESENETAHYSTTIIPISHNFESWGDYYDGIAVYSLAQPVIEPLYGTYQKESIILALVEGKMRNDNYHKYLKEFWEKEIFSKANTGVTFEQFWFSVLHNGVFVSSTTKTEKLVPDFSKVQNINISKGQKSWTMVLKKPYFLADGRFINNPWLLEIPHPITKVTWDNYLAISEKDANALKLISGDLVEIVYNGKKFEVPIFIVPGIAEKTLTIEAGFGQNNVGTIGSNVGFNPLVLFTKKELETGYVLSNISINKLDRKYKLASTVEHHSLNDTFVKDLHKSRHIIQEGTLESYKNGKFQVHRIKEKMSIIPEIKYTGIKWAMVIDLNKCVGCGACITACNVENNVPVVGKDQVIRGREMQWIRIDTYFSGSPENPEISLQPMLCQHCDDAPCENVCPVVATNHSPDGLNQMVYNRCVGTRYCSNNCPYKVRRFNFFDFRNHFANGFFYQDSLKLLNNPEVTVRSRGVMEKCTFCIQRITDARHTALAEGRELKGSEVKTACQEACPANAIIFGDMNDKNSEVSYWRNHQLGYFVLEELNIKPNVTYIAKLRNKLQEDKA
ncbi:MAG: Fe-S cluster-containing hydrogenase [Ignavibacteria bacterium]|nr:Fe-S cluster-containing hydrogenase [Ignavibacteria bacterium]